jgi:hypothetical protein
MTRGCGRWVILGFGAFVALLVGLFLVLRPSGVERRSAVPARLQALAVVPGFSNFIRYFPRDATHVEEFEKDFLASFPIALRAITCLIQNQGLGDLYRIFAITQRDHVDFNLAYIPRSFQVQHTADFDPHYMKALFDPAEQMAEEGRAWEKHPPVLVSGVDQAGRR